MSHPVALNKTALALFNHLIAPVRDAELGTCAKVDNAPGTFMAVHVARLGDREYAVYHWFEQNGDMMYDPEVRFYAAPNGAVYPANFRQDSIGMDKLVLEGDENGRMKYAPRAQADVARFVNGEWFRNIKNQQGIRLPRAA